MILACKAYVEYEARELYETRSPGEACLPKYVKHAFLGYDVLLVKHV